jgi:hypothetical protein
MNDVIDKGPGFNRPQDGQTPSDEASEQVPRQRSMEDDAGSDDSLVKQMSHGDESLVPADTETRGVVGYVDEHGMENRPEEGTREYDKE